MRYVRLGKAGLEVSAIAFGTWAFGGDWGSFDAHDSKAAIHHALDLEMQRDRTIREYVARNGKPDFIYVPSATVVELVYAPSSKLILFYRERPGADSVSGELSPLPVEVTNVLPVDIRAGTPGPIAGNTPTSCWTASAATHRCHTCCKGPLFCSTSCKQERPQSAGEA